MSLDDLIVRNRELIDEGLAQATSLRASAEASGQPSVILIANALQFTLMFNADLHVVLIGFLDAGFSWRERFYARQTALIAHEGFQDFPQLFGGDFRNAIRELELSATAVGELDSALAELRPIRRSYENLVADIRNNITAHRDIDAGEQLSQILALEPAELREVAISLFRWVTRVYAALGALLTEAKARRLTRL